MGSFNENTVEQLEFHESDYLIELIDTQILIEGTSRVDLEKTAAIAYCSGWLAKSLKKIHKNCEICKHNFEAQNKSFHKFIKMKEYNNKTWLCYPTRALFDFFAQVEHVTIEILKRRCNIKKILSYIKFVVDVIVHTDFVACSTHNYMIDYIKNKSIRFFILNWCKDVSSMENPHFGIQTIE